MLDRHIVIAKNHLWQGDAKLFGHLLDGVCFQDGQLLCRDSEAVNGDLIGPFGLGRDSRIPSGHCSGRLGIHARPCRGGARADSDMAIWRYGERAPRAEKKADRRRCPGDATIDPKQPFLFLTWTL